MIKSGDVVRVSLHRHVHRILYPKFLDVISSALLDSNHEEGINT